MFLDQVDLLDLFFLSAFLMIICMGILLPILRVKDLPSFENRQLAKLPSLKSSKSVLELPHQFNHYIEDHFILRNQFIHILYIVRLNYLRENVFPSVVVGEKRWLYYTDEGAMEDYQRTRSFTEDQMAQIWQNLESLHRQLELDGITLVIAIAPNKETIYPDFVPKNIPRLGEKSRLDQLVSYLHNRGESWLLDLRSSLMAAKANDQVYFRTDTHWNSLGAYVAYYQIMQQCLTNIRVREKFPELQPKFRSEFRVLPSQWDGDLANFLTMRGIIVEQTHLLVPNFETRSKIVARVNPNSLEMTREIPDSILPRAILFHDSFGLHVIPFLAEHFSHLTNRWAPYNEARPVPLINQGIIETDRPDIVILIITERYLQYLLW
jgi:alginate O-acetyltransferase complex protein AlgJ